MDYFAKAFSSGCIKEQSSAALFLRAEGAQGYSSIQALLDCCQRVNLDVPQLSKPEQDLVRYGALSMGTIVNAVGFDETILLHQAVLNWLLGLNYNKHLQVAAYSIWGIYHLGIPPIAVRDRLCELINTERRPDDLEFVTCRGTAFRLLARLDRDMANRHSNSDGCRDFIAATDHWVADFRKRGEENTARCQKVLGEASWFRPR